MSESRKEAVVQLEDGELGLRYDFLALGLIEDETGEPFFDPAKVLQGDQELRVLDTRETVRVVDALAHAYSVRRGEKPKTREQIAGMIGVRDLRVLNRAISDLAIRNLPDVRGDEDDEGVQGEGDGAARPTIASASRSPSSGA